MTYDISFIDCDNIYCSQKWSDSIQDKDRFLIFTLKAYVFGIHWHHLVMEIFFSEDSIICFMKKWDR